MTAESTSPATQKKKRVSISEQPLPDTKTFQVQRRRVWRACEGCRRKKIKCDGNEPTCTQCITSKSQCTWLQTKDRAALSRQYVQELETRLLHMETLFNQVTPILEQLGQSEKTSAPSSSSQTPASISPSSAALIQQVLPQMQEMQGIAPSTPPESKRTVKFEDEPTESVSEAFEQLALDEHGHFRWIGNSSTMSLIQSFRALTASPLHRVSPMDDNDPRSSVPTANKLYFPASVFFGQIHALPGVEDVEYPARDLADGLVEAYFSRFHFLLPVLDKPSFLKQYHLLMDNTNDPRAVGIDTAFVAQTFSVFSVAARFLDDPRLSTGKADEGGMGMMYYERALILQYISHASIQPTHVQTFTLLSAFLCSVNCLPQAWILIGQGVRAAQDLGLHRSPRRLHISPIEKETLRKIWWGVYTLDRMFALTLGRPLGIEDSDCDVELPVDVEDEHLPQYFSGAIMVDKQPSLMAGFIAFITLYKIAGSVLRRVYALETWKGYMMSDRTFELHQTVEALDQELTQWIEDLPTIFKSGPVNEQQVSLSTVLCSNYYCVLTTLHRNFLPGKRDQPAIPKSVAKALSSARGCIRLAPAMKNVVPSSMHSTMYLQNLFSSAVIILLYAMHVHDGKASAVAMEEAKACLDAVESWEGIWPGARKCKELLLDLMNTAKEAIMNTNRNGSAGGTPMPPPSPLNPSPQPGSSNLRQNQTTIQTSRPERAARRNVRPKSQDARKNAHERVVGSEASRTRSTSRRRVMDDDEPARSPVRTHHGSPFGSFARRAVSNHSSPGSAGSVPSPPLSHAETIPEEQQPIFAEPQSPTSPGNQGMYTFNPLDGIQQPQFSPDWNTGPNTLGRGASTLSTENPLSGYNGSTSHVYDNDTYPSYGPYAGMVDMSVQPEAFPAMGLPFNGLEFITNYPPDGYSDPTSSSLWQTFDAGAFIQDPETPFSFQDFQDQNVGEFVHMDGRPSQ